MRSKLFAGGVTLAMGFLLVTNPVVVNAAGTITGSDIKNRSVTGKDVKNNSLKGKDVKDHTLESKDLAAGVVPGAAWVGARTSGLDPVANPDGPGDDFRYTFTLPRAGTLQVTLAVPRFSNECQSGDTELGLYLDGKPIPGTMTGSNSTERELLLVGVVSATAGSHAVDMRQNCPTFNGYGGVSYWWDYSWSLVLAP